MLALPRRGYTYSIMAFSASDYQDLVRLLEAQPELCARLRRLVLGDDMGGLRAVFDALARAQLGTEERLAALAERVDRLAEAQQRTEARLE